MDGFNDVKGKVALITGATSGLGAAMAKTYGENGMKVVVLGRNAERGAQVVNSIVDGGGKAVFYQCDVTKEAELKAAVDFTVKTYGALHVMVNNAGGGGGDAPVVDLDTKNIEHAVDLYYKACLWGMKYGIRAMVETKSEGCSVINIASGAGRTAQSGMPLYSPMKAAVISATRTTAIEVAKYDITVNAICPGTFKTSIFDNTPPEQLAIYSRSIPSARMGNPQEIGWLALFLASKMARYINGADIPIDAGKTAGMNIGANFTDVSMFEGRSSEFKG